MVHKKKGNLTKLMIESRIKAEKDIKTFGKKILPVVKVGKEVVKGAKKGFEYSMKGFEMATGLQAKMMDKMWEEQAKMRKEMEKASR